MTTHGIAADPAAPNRDQSCRRDENETATAAIDPTPARRHARRAALAAVSIAALGAGTGAAAAEPVAPLTIAQCPALYVLGVDGTGQSSPGASPSTGTGVLGPMVEPLLAAGPAVVQRAYVPYDASFGGVPGTGGTTASYTASMTGASATLHAMASQIAATCPQTHIAGVGYSQGAHVVSQFATAVGAGGGPIGADRVAGVALYSDPARPGGTTVLPGRPGQTTPTPAPGTSGAAVSTVVLPQTSASGAGIDPAGSRFGALSGRVAEFCTAGDLSCAAPQAPLLRAGAAVAAQASIADPAAAISTLGATIGAVATGVLADDVTVTGGSVNYLPTQSISERAVGAADPRTPAPSPSRHADAAQRWNQITAAVTADPAAALPRLVQQAGTAVSALVAENQALLDPATWIDLPGQHTGYGGDLAAGAQWFAALATDLSNNRPR